MSIKQCIYCMNKEPDVTFNKAEHILPQSFGKFKDNLVLNRNAKHSFGVCDNCNQLFGDSFDRILARDTLEGLYRFKEGIIASIHHKTEGSNSLLKITSLEGPLKGALFYPHNDKDSGEVRMFPLPNQVGITEVRSGIRDFYSIDSLPDKTTIPKKYLTKEGKCEFFLDFSNKHLIKQIREKGYEIDDDPEFTEILVENAKDIEFQFDRPIDDNLSRAVAKIAFNYLCYCIEENYGFQHPFDKIRNFILNSEGKTIDFVEIVKDTKLLEIENKIGNHILGHIITYEYSNGKVYGTVSLFNMIKYRILLANDKKLIFPPIISHGHFFNIATMKADALTQQYSRELSKFFGIKT